MRRSLLIALLAALAPAGAVAAPPNVVVILTDNHGAWTLGCYGNRDIRTPNIDRLASEGLRFTRAYCTQSICSPSRATFLTDLLPSQHGIHACPAESGDAATARLLRALRGPAIRPDARREVARGTACLSPAGRGSCAAEVADPLTPLSSARRLSRTAPERCVPAAARTAAMPAAATGRTGRERPPA